MTSEAELAQVFQPCTLAGLCDEWHRMNMEINAIRKDRDRIAEILLDASVKEHNGAEEAFRLGKAIEGETASVQAVWKLLDASGATPRWKPSLEYVREPKQGVSE